MTPRIEEWVKSGSLYQRRGRPDWAGEMGGARDPFLHPFHETYFFNLPISASALYGSTSESVTASWLIPKAGETQLNGAVNWKNGWSVEVFDGRRANSQLRQFTNPNTGAVLPGGLWVPDDYTPPTGSSGLTADGATVAYQPDGSLWDLYKPIKQADGNWTSTRWVKHNAYATASTTGVRAAGLPYSAGLMRAHECLAIGTGELLWFPHKLALSIPPRNDAVDGAALKATPVASDGFLKLNSAGKAIAIYPANAQDTQVGGNIYNGMIPMGTEVAIPRTTDLETLPEWPTLDVYGRAFWRTLQIMGAVVTDASASWATYLEPSSPAAAFGSWNPTTRTGTGISEAWPLSRKYLRQVKNVTPSEPAGGPAPYLAELLPPLALA